MLEHGAGVGGSEMAWLGVEVEEDGVRLPLSQGANGSLVDARDKEGGGTTGAEAVGFDALWGDVGDMVDHGSCPSEFSGNVLSGDVVRAAGGVEVAVQRGVWGAVECAEVSDAVAQGLYGTKGEATG